MIGTRQQLQESIAYYENALVNQVCDNDYCYTKIGLMSKKWINNIIVDYKLQIGETK